jgi:hypothetical protein
LTVFNTCFLFLDNPNGGVEDIAWLKQNCPWIKGIFCNIRDSKPEQWAVVRKRALDNGLFCGAWGRTTKLDENGNQIEPAIFDPTVVDKIIAITDAWGSSGIVNCEKEIDGKQGALDYIVQKIGPRDIALSVQPNPFESLNWTVAKNIPILPQIFPAEAPGYNPIPTRDKWWSHGIKCVYMTFGTYAGMKPSDFKLQAPYSLFPGDGIMANLTAPQWAPTSSGWLACKPTTPTPGGIMLTKEQVPFTGPYGLPASSFKNKGPTAEALKRAFGHLKLFPWREYNQQYNLALWEVVADYKIKKGILSRRDGSYGEAVWTALRKETYRKDGKTLPAFDPYAQKLIQDEAGITAESDKMVIAQKYISEFWNLAIANERNIHYNNTIRPYPIYVNPNSSFSSDCSMMVIQASGYAAERSGLKLVDPAKQGWSGYGNTDMYEDDWDKIGAPYRVGDLAHFQNSRHVIECIVPGSIADAVWGSHGQEAGPQKFKLPEYNRYPFEFMFVVRPQILA